MKRRSVRKMPPSMLTPNPVSSEDMGRHLTVTGEDNRERVRSSRRPPGVPMGGNAQADNPALYILRTGNDPIGKAGFTHEHGGLPRHGVLEKHLPGEHDQKKHGHGRQDFDEELRPRGKLTTGQKRKIRKQMVDKYGSNGEFAALATALAFFTQGFYKPIREVGAAMATNTMEDLEANALGYFGDGLDSGKKDPLMAIAAMADIEDVYGHSNHGEHADKSLDDITYLKAQTCAHALARAIEDAEPTSEPLYRGVVLNIYEERQMEELKVGDSFDLPAPTSFTRDIGIADGFIHGTTKGAEGRKGGGGVGYMIEVRGENKAIDVDVFSTFHQQEAVSNGRFKVVEHEPPRPFDLYHRKERRTGRLVLEQQGVVDSNFPEGRGVVYPLPKEVGKTLNTDERSAVMELAARIKTTPGGMEWDNDIDDIALGRPAGGKVDIKKVGAALKQLGFWVGVNPAWHASHLVVRRHAPTDE